MAFLIRKFQELDVKSALLHGNMQKVYAEQLFLWSLISFNRLGKNADEKDAEEIIQMASKASVADQQRQVQENIHYQIQNICNTMDDILHPDNSISFSGQQDGPKRSGLSFAMGNSASSAPNPDIPQTKQLSRAELSFNLKDRIGYTLDIKPSQIPHEQAGLGLFLSGECNVGSVVAFYPGVIYSPAYYRHIPGYPRVDSCNPYLITRYDDFVINAQPWGVGGESRGVWNSFYQPNSNRASSSTNSRLSDRIWDSLSTPLENSGGLNLNEVLELRNPLAFAHFANHPAKGSEPNVMVCPYDFSLAEKNMRAYIPNVSFGGQESVTMKRIGTFWYRSNSASERGMDAPIMKTLVLIATRQLCEEEVYLNYRLSNLKRRPLWYSPVNEEEDKRRWS